jgi:elongation factor G
MVIEAPDKIRNVVLAGHNDTGKTTLTSALLYASGAVSRMSRVEDGNTTTDFDPEEISRGISIGLATCHAPWKGHKVNLIDTPGYSIFFTETKAGMRAADALLLCVSAVAGTEVNTERVWEFAGELDLPALVVLNKMDRERADLDRALESLRHGLAREIVPVQIPIGSESGFTGVVDLVHLQAWRFERNGNGAGKEVAIPAEMADEVESRRGSLIEAVAETDDALMEHFFEEGSLSQEALEEGLRRAVRSRKLFPLLMASGASGIGSSALLDAFLELVPSPVDRPPFPATGVGGDEIMVQPQPGGPFSALVFKTLSDPFSGKISIFRVVSGSISPDSTAWNTRAEDTERIGTLLHMQGKAGQPAAKLVTGDIGGTAKLKLSHTGDTLCARERSLKLDWIHVPEAAISFAIEPKAKGDEEKIGDALHRLMEEDLALKTGRDLQTGEYLVSGTGQLHVEIAVAKLKHRYHVEVVLHPPKVPYRETILRPADGHGRHKKQSGGRGQFADCKIVVEPLERGADFAFADEIFGGAIPHNFRPAVEKGIQEARRRGFLAGYPMVDFKVRLIDGQYHDVDSSEMAFKIAGSLAYKDAMAKARATILEPIMKIEVTSSDEYTGDIIGDLSQRRGKPQGMDSKNGQQIIKAQVPMAEILNYAPALRSMTQGRASFHVEFSHYEEVPRPVQEKLIAEAARHKQDEDDSH